MERKYPFFSDICLTLSIILLIISLLSLGCGKTNILQGLTKPEEHESTLEAAQTYLDNGQYDKAISAANDLLKKDADDSDALAIKGQAYLGKAGGGLTDVLAKTGGHKDVSSNFNALSIITKSELNDLYTAADILRGLHSTDKNISLAEGVACMLSAVAKVTWTFNPVEGLLNNPPGPNEPASAADISLSWNMISGNVRTNSMAAVTAIAYATGYADLRNTVASIDEQIASVSAQIGAIPYGLFLTILGY